MWSLLAHKKESIEQLKKWFRWHDMQIRTRLTLQFMLIVTTILLVFSMGIYYFSAIYRENDFYGRLKDRAFTSAKLLFVVKEVDNVLLKIIDKNSNTLIDEQISVYDENNRLLYCSVDTAIVSVSEQILQSIHDENEYRFNINGHEGLGIEYPTQGRTYYVIAMAHDLFGFRKLKNLRLVLFFGFIISEMAIFVAGYFYAGRALSPITEIIDQVQGITISNLNLRLNEGNGKDELALLANTFNEMLGGLEKSFILQRDFIANASHELRTPITIVAGEIDYLLLQNRSNEDYKQSLQTIAVDLRQFNETLSALFYLSLTSMEGKNLDLTKIRIDELLLDVRQECLKTHPNYRIDIDYGSFPEDENMLILEGYSKLLSIAFRNIIDNGCKFSDNMRVQIHIETSEGICLIFKDEGIGIKKEELAMVFDPFVRGKEVRHIAGHGLGLALAKKVIDLHNGEISIHSVEQKGTQITVHFHSALNK